MGEAKAIEFPKDELETDIEAAFAELEQGLEPDLETESEAEEAPEVEAEPADEETDLESGEDQEAEPVEAQAPTDLPPIEVPARFNEEEKKAFNSVPRWAQEAITRLEGSNRRFLTSKTEEIAKTRQQYAPLESALAPHRGYMEQRGITPERLVSEAIQLIQARHENPVGTLMQLAAAWNVDPRQLIGEQAPTSGTTSPDPHLLQMQRELAGVKGLLTQRQQAEQQQVYEHHHNTAAAWRDERDEQGNLLRPFLEIDAVTGEAVYPDFQKRMQREIEAIALDEPGLQPQELLARAYDNTVWVVPTARQKLEEQRAKQAAEQQKQKIKEAKRAGKSVSNSLGLSLKATAGPADLEDEIREFFQERGI